MSTIDSHYDLGQPNTLHINTNKFFLGRLATGILVLVGPLAACDDAPPEALPPESAAPQPVVSTCGERGALQGSLSGAISADIHWLDANMRCESMSRPDAKGVRLRFSGDVGGERLAIIIAMPELTVGATGDEFDSNVTITVEGSGRFFSTPNLDSCWTEIVVHEPLPGETDTYVVGGELSCVVPLGEINGDAFVDVRSLSFSGVADWSEK